MCAYLYVYIRASISYNYMRSIESNDIESTIINPHKYLNNK